MVQELISKGAQLIHDWLSTPVVWTVHAAVEHAVAEFGVLALLAITLGLELRRRLSAQTGD